VAFLLLELDTQLTGPTELHCFGGFVVAQCYGLMRPTADIDILESKGTDLLTIAKLAGRTSSLHKRHGVYIDVVTVADVPDNYDERLTTALDESFEKLQFRIFERHDLVLAKIVRNNDKDRADVAAIAGGPGLDIDVFPRVTSRSSGQSLTGRNAKTSRSSSGSRSSRKRGSAGRGEHPRARRGDLHPVGLIRKARRGVGHWSVSTGRCPRPRFAIRPCTSYSRSSMLSGTPGRTKVGGRMWTPSAH
jgi:hypothetical protein